MAHVSLVHVMLVMVQRIAFFLERKENSLSQCENYSDGEHTADLPFIEFPSQKTCGFVDCNHQCHVVGVVGRYFL